MNACKLKKPVQNVEIIEHFSISVGLAYPTMLQQGKISPKIRSNLAINSVALQDHISKNLLLQNLSLSCPVKLKCPRKSSTDRKKPNERGSGKQEVEYVLDQAPPPLTLAQKLGLVASPAKRLTTNEWSQVKTRSVHEGDSVQPCVICREEFRLQPQVLLSCSHVFHRACLKAFEKYSGRKCCPMCRKEHYETRVIHDGAQLFRQKCATRIQAYWRGYVARRSYRKIRKTIPPKDKQLRKKFFEEKLQELNDSFVQHCDTDVDAFLQSIDQSVLSSRRVFHQFESKRIQDIQEDDWDRIQNQVIQRDTRDCPICLTPLWFSILGSEAIKSPQPNCRQAVLLSCSHIFHQPCLEAFEGFCMDFRPTCPLCRSPYHKRLV